MQQQNKNYVMGFDTIEINLDWNFNAANYLELNIICSWYWEITLQLSSAQKPPHVQRDKLHWIHHDTTEVPGLLLRPHKLKLGEDVCFPVLAHGVPGRQVGDVFQGALQIPMFLC